MEPTRRYRAFVTAECVGSAQCIVSAPEAFALDADGFSTVQLDEVPPSMLEAVKVAELSCPMGAIRLLKPGGSS